MSHSDLDIETRDHLEDWDDYESYLDSDKRRVEELTVMVENARSALEVLQRNLIHKRDRMAYYNEQTTIEDLTDYIKSIRGIEGGLNG